MGMARLPGEEEEGRAQDQGPVGCGENPESLAILYKC